MDYRINCFGCGVLLVDVKGARPRDLAALLEREAAGTRCGPDWCLSVTRCDQCGSESEVRLSAVEKTITLHDVSKPQLREFVRLGGRRARLVGRRFRHGTLTVEIDGKPAPVESATDEEAVVVLPVGLSEDADLPVCVSNEHGVHPCAGRGVSRPGMPLQLP